jgi:hypothetical protein
MSASKKQKTVNPITGEPNGHGDDKTDVKADILGLWDAPSAPVEVKKMRPERGSGGSNTALCKTQGVAVRTGEIEVASQTPGGKDKKPKIDQVVLDIIPNGAQDVVSGGVPGFDYLLPTKAIKGPAEAEQGNKFAKRERELMLHGMSTVADLNSVSTSFYKDSAKNGDPTSVQNTTVAQLVEFTGNCFNHALRNNQDQFYSNASSCKHLSGPVQPKDVGEKMIEICDIPKQQLRAAVMGSVAHAGFYDLTDMNEAQIVQAKACQALWEKALTNIIASLEAKKEGKSAEGVMGLQSHIDRLSKLSMEKVARGDEALFMTGKYDSQIAPLVIDGFSPTENKPDKILKLLGGAVEAASLPESFVAAWVRNVEAGEKMENDAMVDLKNSVSVDISCAFVFDKQAALDALEKGVNPLLKPDNPTVAVQLSLRDLANKFMSQRTEGPAKGTFSRAKAVLGAKELLPHAMRAGVFAKVSLIQGGAVTSMKSEFPEGGTVFADMAKTISQGGVRVSEAFVKKNIVGGGDSFVPNEASPEAEPLEPLEGAMPTSWRANAYLELTEASWKFDNIGIDKHPGKTRRFYVVYKGVKDHLKSMPHLCEDEKKGEDHLTTVAAAAETDLKAMMNYDALVYVVAV